MRYVFYLPSINELTSLSKEDWDYLCELAAENNVPPSTLASRIIANELAQCRDQEQYAQEMEQQFANQQMIIDKQIEELVHEITPT